MRRNDWMRRFERALERLEKLERRIEAQRQRDYRRRLTAFRAFVKLIRPKDR